MPKTPAYIAKHIRQVLLDGFSDLWRRAAETDALFGVRQNRQDPLVRIWLSRLVRALVWLVLGARLRDSNVPCKIVRAAVWREASRFIPADTLTPSLLLAAFARLRGYRVVEYPVRHREREVGESTLRYGKLLRFCVRAFGQLLAFRWRLLSSR